MSLDFEPDDEIDFQLDFQPDEEEEPNLLKKFWTTINTPMTDAPSRLGKSIADRLDPIDRRNTLEGLEPGDRGLLGPFIAGSIEGAGDVASSLTSPLNAILSLIGLGEAGAAYKGLTRGAKILGVGRKVLSAPIAGHGMGEIISPDSTMQEKAQGLFETAGGGLGMKVPLASPKILPKKPQLALPSGKLFGGPEGGSGQVSFELGPVNEARLSGVPMEQIDGQWVPVGKQVNDPAAHFTDLGEVREADRIARLYFTEHEQMGGSSLELPDQPNMSIPPRAGDTRLGFDPIHRSGLLSEELPELIGDSLDIKLERSRRHPMGQAEPLEYPLNIVPERLRPRSTQTVTRSLTGDEMARPLTPKDGIEFVSDVAPEQTPVKPQRDLKGGTAALIPGEEILPSARQFKEASRNTGINVDEQTFSQIPEELKTPAAKLIAEESNLPSPWKSIRTTLKQLSPELWRREVRSVQIARQYDAGWVPAFEQALNKLTKTEKQNFGSYVEGTVTSPSDNVTNAVNIWRAVESSIGDEATARGLRLYKGKEHIPFRKNTDNYWPRIPKERYSEPGLLERLMKGGMTRNEANRVITHYQNSGEIIIGPQHSRIGHSEVPYRLDADAGLAHIRAMSKRIAQHRELGPLDIEGKGTAGVADLIEGTTDSKLALTLMRRLVGREEPSNPRLIKILDGLRKYTAVTKLQNFTLPNMFLGQPATALKASRHPVAAITELSNLFKRRYREDLSKSGAWQNFNYTVAEELKGRDIYLIGAGETFNRGIAASVGKAVAKEAFAELKRKPNSKQAKLELENLVLEPLENVLKQDSLTPDQLTMAAGRMAEVTQGLNIPGNLPYWASNPVKGPLEFAGQLVWQLKKMGYQATKNVWDSVNPKTVGPVQASKNLGLWLVMSQIAGELTGDSKTFLRGLWKGDPESEVAERGNWWLEGSGISPTMINEASNMLGIEPQILSRLMDNWTQAFFLGLPADLLMASSYGPAGLTDSLLGPVASDIRKFGYNLAKLNEKGLAKDTIRALPIPGSSGLAETLTED